MVFTVIRLFAGKANIARFERLNGVILWRHTRCVGTRLFADGAPSPFHLESRAGLLRVEKADGGLVTVDMGEPRFACQVSPDLVVPAIVSPTTLPVYSTPAAVKETSSPLSLPPVTGVMTLPFAMVPVKV